MHVKSVEAQTCGVEVGRGGCQLSCRPHHLTMVQNYESCRVVNSRFSRWRQPYGQCVMRSNISAIENPPFEGAEARPRSWIEVFPLSWCES
ncbi:hypothetical protein TNCV_3502131 [Trichonephila clavipes]|uniref:Uncharacterized protein n=1 Tax=Trichonephila clavipes TaxID=2585209 RepID=A0A8X6S5E4_TRICX|nr:hypothetical protein TNCV_3502131 [Trichonephila clavipes]